MGLLHKGWARRVVDAYEDVEMIDSSVTGGD